jgi:hypothetical protein
VVGNGLNSQRRVANMRGTIREESYRILTRAHVDMRYRTSRYNDRVLQPYTTSMRGRLTRYQMAVISSYEQIAASTRSNRTDVTTAAESGSTKLARGTRSLALSYPQTRATHWPPLRSRRTSARAAGISHDRCRSEVEVPAVVQSSQAELLLEFHL